MTKYTFSMSKLKKELTLFGLIMIAIGSCIGSGIFKTPAGILEVLPHAGLTMIIWAVGGVISLFGALSFAEMGSMYPKAGGIYVYLKESFGEMTAFLYGWVTLFIINTGALAALSITMVDYLSFFIEMNTYQKLILASGLLIVLTYINIRGVKWSEIFSNLFTGLKMIAILLMVGVAFWYMGNAAHSTQYAISGPSIPPNWVSGMLLALVGVFWSFGGWHHISYLSGEAKSASRNIPLGMIIGTVIVTVVYLLVNFAYMALLPIDEIIASEAVAGDALSTVFKNGGALVSIMIIISVTGTIGIYTMTAPRIYYAMAKDGIFFKQLSKLHPKYDTPALAMNIQTIWAILLLFAWESFTRIITFVTFMDIIFMMLAALALFILRYKKPDIDRPVKALAYPIIPGIFILVTAAFVVNTAFSMHIESLAGFIILLAGIPVYRYFKRNRENGKN
jgi:APA family basic amino acid/polyamine antiporter